MREIPDPPQADGVVPVTVLTIGWLVAFLVLLPLRSRLAAHGAEWWVWACLVGFLLGLLGRWFVVRRRDAYRRAGVSASGQS